MVSAAYRIPARGISHSQLKMCHLCVLSVRNDLRWQELSLVPEDKTFLPSLRSSLENSPEFTKYEVQNIEFTIAHGGQGTESWQELGNELRHTLTLMRCKEPGKPSRVLSQPLVLERCYDARVAS